MEPLSPVHPAYEYGSVRGEAGREESPVLQGNDSAGALVWMGAGRAAKQSEAGTGCGHACDLSQSEGAPMKHA